MTAQSTAPTAHWSERNTSHWTRDGRLHTGALETCTDCAVLPDVREPRPFDSH